MEYIFFRFVNAYEVSTSAIWRMPVFSGKGGVRQGKKTNFRQFSIAFPLKGTVSSRKID